MKEFIVIIGAGLLAAGYTFTVNWLSLIPWRRNRNRHWTEQARLVFPVRTAARSNLWVIPAILALAVTLLWPESSPLWFFTGIAAAVGAYIGTVPLDREIHPQAFVPGWQRTAIIHLVLRFLAWFVFIGATVWMPSEFNFRAILIGTLVTSLWLFWQRGAAFWLGTRLGLYIPAPERLQKIADATSARMQIFFREVILIKSQTAQAFAFPQTRRLGFTERLVDICTDDELAAICAHELAHLTESKKVHYTRQVQMLAILPWMFFNPLIQNFSIFAFFGLLISTVAIPRICLSVTHKMEKRADQMAKVDATDGGIYARALTKIYENNLIPAVTGKKPKSHPDLYDRILAAGVIPDFPRPIATDRMAGHGHVLAGIMGLLFAIFAIRLMQTTPGGFIH